MGQYRLAKELHWPYPDLVKACGYDEPLSAKEIETLFLIRAADNAK